MDRDTLLPAGFSDKIFPRSQKNSLIIENIVNFFLNYGYLRISPPLIEFEETLLNQGPGLALKNNSFRVMDPISKKMMAVRSDMTTQISRISSKRLAHYPRPLRLSYSGEVLRVNPSGLKLERQIAQVGAEIIGDITYDLEIEIIIIGLKALKELDLRNLTLDLNYQDLRLSLLKNLYEMPDSDLLVKAIEKKDINFLKNKDFPNKNNILNIIQASGQFTNKSDFFEKLNQDNKKNNFLLHLIEVSSSLQKLFKGLDIVIDPLEKSTFDYHYGLTFTIFSKFLHGSIAKGGTYKTINEEDATGISLYIDLLGEMKGIFKAKDKVLLEQNDFKNAENLIKQGYQVIFFKNLNNNIINYAKSMNCKYFFKNNKLTQV
ncbi:ATP phosphoribosyltransferase regulatory subunit [Alphaproteobacteria bacterium]|nr:ATP phosphoribosyltransferase regulatory subunit [Alphaproteobacteria bacterium]